MKSEQHKFHLGWKLKSLVTGQQGIATARCEYMNGCIQYCVCPPVDEKGQVVEGQYADEQTLAFVDEGIIDALTSEDVPPGGPAGNAPTQYRG